MREYRFRGKRIDNGEWVDGYLVNVCDGESLNRYPQIVISYNHDTFDWFEVIQESVGEYTGIKDKNGKAIFEGDILATSQHIENHPDDYDVWSKEDFGYTVVMWDEKQTRFRGSVWFWETKDCSVYYLGFVEVIGNIFDNPELVKP